MFFFSGVALLPSAQNDGVMATPRQPGAKRRREEKDDDEESKEEKKTAEEDTKVSRAALVWLWTEGCNEAFVLLRWRLLERAWRMAIDPCTSTTVSKRQTKKGRHTMALDQAGECSLGERSLVCAVQGQLTSFERDVFIQGMIDRGRCSDDDADGDTNC